MKAMRYTLERLNVMPADVFVETLASIFEHSPWVAEAVAGQRPFASISALHAAMSEAVGSADAARQLTLINAHPELAGKAAMRGELTAASADEQSGAGLDQCTAEEFNTLQQLNSAYREKFGFPFIFAVRGYDRREVMTRFTARIACSRVEELRANLQQIDRIARFRLDELIVE